MADAKSGLVMPDGTELFILTTVYGSTEYSTNKLAQQIESDVALDDGGLRR